MVFRVKYWFGLLALWLVAGCEMPDTHPLPAGKPTGLVPMPLDVSLLEGEANGRGFRCEGTLTLMWPEGWDMSAITDWLEEAQLTWSRTSEEGEADWIWHAAEEDLGQEGYTLTVKRDQVTMSAGDAEAAFRAWTTLRQVLPETCEQGCASGFTLPAMHIEDRAFLKHRGLLLDCCRHFMKPDFVKEVIEVLALQKMNVLHWHLTEDQGWRLPIQAYPKLTEVGAYRTESDGEVTGGHTRERTLKTSWPLLQRGTCRSS